MNILFPIAEAAPLYKIGGLGDVGSALPKALTDLGVDVRLIIPLHPEIKTDQLDLVEAANFSIDYHNHTLPITVFLTKLPHTKVPVYLIKEDTYLSQHTGASDNHADKFSVFSLAISAWVAFYSPYWQPHIIHCHDWHTALVPVILKHKFHKHYLSMITIHNLAYQGVTTTPVVEHLGLPKDSCRIIQWDQADGDLNILLEGLLHADVITTVSPTYAQEILTTEYGERIESILETRKSKIIGVLNGVDTQEYNPATDPFINPRYDTSNWQTGRQANRQELRRELNLDQDEHKWLISFVGRADPYQKGIGLIIQAINQKLLPPSQCQFIFLGTGDPHLENELHAAAKNHPEIRIITRFDEPLSRRIYASSHLMVIPSRFEPCGLVQLIAHRYGSLPIARATGGLKDTIDHDKNGFLFTDFSVDAFINTLNHAVSQICNHDLYEQMVNNALLHEISWRASANKYAMLYETLVTGSALKNPD